MKSALHLRSRPIRTVFRWQGIATAGCALIAALMGGTHGAWSALAGGAISAVGGLVFVLIASIGRTDSAPGVVVGMLRAEAAKVVAIVALLWIVFATYRAVVAPALIGTFALTTIIFSLAIAIREH